MSNSQLNKSKYGVKSNTEVTLKFFKWCWRFTDENNLLHGLLLSNVQVSKISKAFTNNSSANIKLSKTRSHKIGQSEGF